MTMAPLQLVTLVRTVGGVSFTDILGKTAVKVQSRVTGGTFSTGGEGKLGRSCWESLYS